MYQERAVRDKDQGSGGTLKATPTATEAQKANKVA